MAAKDISQCTEEWKVVFPVNTTYIPDELKQRAKTELFEEDDDTRVNSLRLFKSMVRDQADFKCQEDELLLLAFLRARKYDLKRAFILMKNFYNVALKYDELFNNFNFNNVKRTLQQMKIGCLPYRDSEGCVILVYQFAPWDTHLISMGDIMLAITCLIHVALRSPASQIAGIKMIIDYAGLSLHHIPHVSLTYLWLAADGMQNSFPARFRGVHVVNESLFFTSIWSILKQFLSKKIKDRWHFHGKNIKKLHKYLSPSILPAEYQGELPPFENSTSLKEAEKYADYLSNIFSTCFQKNDSRAERKDSSGNLMHFLRRLSNTLSLERRNSCGTSTQAEHKFPEENRCDRKNSSEHST